MTQTGSTNAARQRGMAFRKCNPPPPANQGAVFLSLPNEPVVAPDFDDPDDMTKSPSSLCL